MADKWIAEPDLSRLSDRHFNNEERTYFVAKGYKNYRFGRPKAGKNRLVDLPAPGSSA
jgi:hypothetical protein